MKKLTPIIAGFYILILFMSWQPLVKAADINSPPIKNASAQVSQVNLEKAKTKLHKVVTSLEVKLRKTRSKIQRLQKIQRMARKPKVPLKASFDLLLMVDDYLERTAAIKNGITLVQDHNALKNSGDEIHRLISDIKGELTTQIKTKLKPEASK